MNIYIVYICSLIESKVWFAYNDGICPSWQRVVVTGRVCISASRYRRFVAADRPSVVFPLTWRSDRKRTWYRREPAVVSYRRRGLGIPVPEQAGTERRRKRRRRRRRKGSWHAARGTRGSFSRRPGILHSLRLQEPQTRASIWASASRHLSLPCIPRRRATTAPVSLPISLPLSLFSRIAYSQTSRFRVLRTLCSSLVSRFLFFLPESGPNWSGRASLTPYRRARILAGNL